MRSMSRVKFQRVGVSRPSATLLKKAVLSSLLFSIAFAILLSFSFAFTELLNWPTNFLTRAIRALEASQIKIEL